MVETPTLTRRQLGVKLRKWRNRSGLSLDDIEAADIMSIPKMYKLEGGKFPKPSWPEIQELAKLYGAPADEVKELARMAKACLVSGWYVPFDVPQQFQTYLDLEGAASRLRFYENEYVNGLFQVEAYIRAIQESGSLIGAQADPHVRFRTQRINRFWGRKPLPIVDLVLSEATLRRIVGGPSAMAAQVSHLRELDASPQVNILIVPFSAGPHLSMEGKYTIMEFNRDEYPNVVYLESRSECQYHERLAVLALYERSWTETLKLAVPMKEFEL